LELEHFFYSVNVPTPQYREFLMSKQGIYPLKTRKNKKKIAYLVIAIKTVRKMPNKTLTLGLMRKQNLAASDVQTYKLLLYDYKKT